MSSKQGAGGYTRVGEKKGSLQIRGALKKIDDDPSFVYIPMYRVAGPLKDVKVYLKEQHADNYDVALDECYSKRNLERGEVRDLFDQEVEDAIEARAETLRSKNEERRINLMVLVQLVKMYDDQKPVKEKTQTVTLKERVKSLSPDKRFLDITTMKKKGNNIEKLTVRKVGDKRRLSQDSKDALYYVIYDPKSKSSHNGVRNFLENYGGLSSQIDKVVEGIKNGNIINVAKGKSPTRSLISPRRSRKQRDTARDDVSDLLD